MSKRTIKVLSMVLTLVMILSVSTPAFAWGGIDTGKGWDRQIGEDDFRDFEPVEETEDEEEYDYFQTLDEDTGIQVTVEALMGSLPMLAELRAEPVEIEEIREAVESVVEGEANIILALDISFWMNGIEIEPEDAVRVKISAPELEGKSNLTLVHIPDEDEPETVDLIDEEELSFALGTNEIAFEADSFSVYALTWKDEESNTVQSSIYWGTLSDTFSGDFTEFDAAAIDASTSVGSVSLRATYPDYQFVDAVYYASKPASVSVDRGTSVEGRTFIGTTITRVAGEDSAYTWTVDNDEEGTALTIEEGSCIYVIYQKETTPAPTPDSGADDESVASPSTTKDVTQNPDGTYTITLDVVGGNVTETTQTGANVIIVFDNSGSMDADVGNNKTRLQAAKDAVGTLVTALNPGTNDIDFALVYFAASATKNSFNGSNWTKSGSDLTSAVNALNLNSGGTNWNQALQYAYEIAETADKDNTYVIFVTDGCPSTNSTYSSGHSHGKNGTSNTTDACYTSALAYAKSIAGTKGTSYSTTVNSGYQSTTITKDGLGCFLYGIYTGTDNTNLLNTLINDANGTSCITATSDDEITEAFNNIASTIIENLGASNVSVDDGIPSLSSVSASVSGEASGFVYLKKAEGETDFSTWTDAPGASYTQENGVVWDLSEAGTLSATTTYRLQFTVWPSQEAYDTIADLNNGLITMTQDELDAAGIGGNKEEGYYLLTNTHLKTSYTFKGETYQDSPVTLPTDQMKLPTTTITVKKIWNNDLDARTASDVTLTITKDRGNYFDVKMGEPTVVPGSGGKQWVQTPEKEIYISMGQLTLDGDNNIDVISSGHDYTVVEPASFSYNWELTADNYHPMVINGTATVLVEVTEEQKAALPADVSGLAQNKHIEKDDNHYYAFNGKLYVAQSGENVLTATNDRRSNLNLTKTVEAAEGIQIPEDGLFTYSIKITYPEGINDSVWFSIQDDNGSYILNGDYGVNDYITGATQEADKTMDDSYTNVVFHEADDTHHYNYYTYTRYGENLHAPAADDGTGTTHIIHTGFYFAPDATAFTVKLRAGWNVRFTNMPNDTQYEFIETAQDDGYVFKTAASTVDRDGTPGALEEGTAKVTGTIDKPNNIYTTTYTNTCLGFFYVYHSADNTIERYPMAENGKEIYVDGKTFDIAHLTKAGSLYGGYYKDYKNKGISDEEILKLTSFPYTDDKGTAYAGATDVWEMKNAYGVSGLTMVPVVNTVYYLKEVPDTKYLRPYLHYTYKLTNNEITASWLISDVDDANYLNTGFVVTNTKDNVDKAKVVSSLKVTNTNNGNYIKLTPKIVFDADGYLTYVEVMQNSAALTDATGFQAGCKVQEFWVTPDGLFVTGITLRTYGVINDHDDINNAAIDDDVSSSISVYTAP